MLSSSYIHIPFCKSICSYCDFCKILYDVADRDKYLDSLKKEIKQNYKNEILNTIYIGGGSPSSLSVHELKKLFEIIDIFNLSDKCEFTFEANVLDINEEMLKLLKDNKVNRLSIGIETINEKFMPFLNRFNKKDVVIEKINLVKKYFDNFNLDLMYAFPSESLEDLKIDLDFVISLNPTHISIYSLIIEPHTKIYNDKVESIDDELEKNMYFMIIDYLEKYHYHHYEISNFSKEGYQSIHNLTYWNNNEYYGFGLGASGFVSNVRYANIRNINKYINGEYILEKEEMTKVINMENELILGLRKTKGISKKVFYAKYKFNVSDVFDIMDLINKKLIGEDEDYIFIPKDKLYVSNSILVNFIGGSKI